MGEAFENDGELYFTEKREIAHVKKDKKRVNVY